MKKPWIEFFPVQTSQNNTERVHRFCLQVYSVDLSLLWSSNSKHFQERLMQFFYGTPTQDTLKIRPSYGTPTQIL